MYKKNLQNKVPATIVRHKSHAKNVGSDFTVGFINNFYFFCLFVFFSAVVHRQQRVCSISACRPFTLPPSVGRRSSNLGHKSYTAAPITVKNERTGKPFRVMEKSAKIIQCGLGAGAEKKTFRFDPGLSADRGDFGRMIGSGGGSCGDDGSLLLQPVSYR